MSPVIPGEWQSGNFLKNIDYRPSSRPFRAAAPADARPRRDWHEGCNQ